MHIHPDGILIVAGRYFAQIEAHCIERGMDSAVIPDILQDTVNQADDAAFTPDVLWCSRVARGILRGDYDRVADSEFAIW
jgi:hypothetical protein